MDRETKVKHFAGAVFSYIYRSYNSTFNYHAKLPIVFNFPDSAEFSDEIGRAVLEVCVSCRETFTKVFERSYNQVICSDKQFMTFLTSRCLKLCNDDLFLSFVIICAFIAELNLYCISNNCLTFVNTAPKCLVAIFNRRLNKEFYARGGWETLKLFCEKFNNDMSKDGAKANGSAEHKAADASCRESVRNILELLDESSSSEDESESEDSDSMDSDSSDGEASDSSAADSALNSSEDMESNDRSEDGDESSDDSEPSSMSDEVPESNSEGEPNPRNILNCHDNTNHH